MSCDLQLKKMKHLLSSHCTLLQTVHILEQISSSLEKKDHTKLAVFVHVSLVFSFKSPNKMAGSTF